MIYISHRGNINGKKETFENHPDYIEYALFDGYNVEVDIWYSNNEWYLGHDEPTYQINNNFIENENIWFHTKNIDALNKLNTLNKKLKYLKYFWHQNDDFTLTSNGYLWTFPNKPLTNKSICVLPELSKYSYEDIKKCYGICSDYILKYKKD